MANNAIRTQEQLFAFGKARQSAAQASNLQANLIRLSKLNADLAFPNRSTEDDAAEMGRGDEFATQQFAVSWETRSSIRKYLTSQIAMWAYTFGLGHAVSSDAYTSIITPQDPTVDGIELPYFTALQQFRPNQVGGAPMDQAIVGCAIAGFTIDLNSGTGRQASQISIDFEGIGKFNEPSGLTAPAASPEVQLPAAGASVLVNGIDYIGNANRGKLLSLRLGLANNFDANSRFFIGSGYEIAGNAQSGAIGGRLEFMNRVFSLSLVVRMSSTAAEFALLRNMTKGTATVGLSGGGTDNLTVQHPSVGFRSVTLSDTNNIATFQIDCTILKDPVLGPIVVTAQNSTIPSIGIQE